MSLFRTLIRTPRFGAVLLVPAALMIGCTDLKETPTSLLTADNFYKNADEVTAGVVSVYASIRSYFDDMYEMNQISSDEGVIPVRGTDWFDNGEHLEVHRQTWSASSVVGQREVNGIWNSQYSGIARANIVLEQLEKVTVPNQAAIKAELRALRALFYYNLMDFYGAVPIATDTKSGLRAAAASRAAVFTFIETELKAARADLPKSWDSQYGRMTQGAADAILASMYINAQVFTGTVSATGIALGAAKWTEASAQADLVINSGTYTLEPNFKDNFKPTNQTSRENIFVVRNKAVDGLGYFRQYGALHYNSFSGGGWNGWSVVEQTYNKFDAGDTRRTQILAGPQVDLFTGAPVFDRQLRPLVFTPVIADITAANEGEGARLYKFPLDPAKAAQNSGNDLSVYRLAEMYLIKAEAQNELGNTAVALGLVNTIRARAFSPAKPLVGLNQAQLRQAIFDERIFELIGEGKRRQDQIRQGTYTSGTWFGKTVTNTPYKVILPIPQSQIETNNLLKQNPGY